MATRRPVRDTASGNPNGIRRSTNAQDLQLRRYQALELRIAGKTYREIKDTLGINQSTLLHDIDVVLREREDGNIAKLRAIEEERLDVAVRAACEIIEAHPGTELALKAVDRLIRASARRAGLLGLDAPTRVEVESLQVTQADLELQELIREARARNNVVKATIVGDDADSPA